MPAGGVACAVRAIAVTVILCAAGVHAGGTVWFDLGPVQPRETRVEVDLSSLRQGLLGPELKLRVTPHEQQGDQAAADYLSFVTWVRLDCDGGTIAPLTVSFYASARGGGREVARESDLTAGGIRAAVLKSLPGKLEQMLLKAACTAS